MSETPQEEKYGIVVVLDALGVKGIWKRQEAKSVLDRWNSVIHSMQVDIKSAKKVGMEFNFSAFSDTLIITLTNGKVDDMLKQIGIAIGSMMNFALSRGIYFRGAMSIGKFFESEMMVIGPAIDEAAMNFEQANWIGVHVTPSIWSFIRKNPKEFSGHFIEYDVPTHSKPIKTFALTMLNELGPGMQETMKVKTMLEFMHKHLEESSDPEGFEKWKNTIEFTYYCKNQL